MEQQWNAKNRDAHLRLAQGGEFDLLIIGGGITGAGVAREAALRGLTFCMIDKNDFAFGTSSRSSKLAHGGLRYLAQKEFKLVRESTTERNWLMAHMPHNVRPLGFMYCCYERGKDKAWQIAFALKLYDLLSNWNSPFRNFRRAKFFTRSFVEEFEPAITQYDDDLGMLTMSGFYYDTNLDDARLTLETIKESLQLSPGSVALNYARMDEYIKEGGKVRGVRVHDELGDNSFEVRAKAVTVCGGIWTDELLKDTEFNAEKIYPTKGVHIVVPNERLGNRNAFGIRSFDDGRFFFVLRRGKVSVIGTTDTDYYQESQNLAEPWCTKEDADYLLRTVNRLFPHANLTYDDIIGTYAGIRPLIKQEGAANESAVSREHEIFESRDGVVAMAGGKLTTYRLMAEEFIFHLVNRGYLPDFDNQAYMTPGFSQQPFGVGMARKAFDQAVKQHGYAPLVNAEQLDHLYQQYGKQGLEILEAIQADPAAGNPLIGDEPYCRAEIEFILEHENAPHLLDVLCRRTEAQWMVWHHRQGELAAGVAGIMAAAYGWDDKRKAREIDAYLAYVKKTIFFE